MPTICPITFPRLSDDEMRPIDYQVMGHAFATHCKLGRLCDESVYQRELLSRLHSDGIEAAIEVPVNLSHGRFSIDLALDLVVDQKVIYELKTAAGLSSSHAAQLIGYLYLTNTTRGKLINFRPPSVESRFVNTTLDNVERRRFTIDVSKYDGNHDHPAFVRELIEDWGTGLDSSLYWRAILTGLGSEVESERMLPMVSNGHAIGNQRFHLLDSETALGVTTFSTTTTENEQDFSKLISLSPLRRLHWVNITHHHVTLSTIHSSR
jgi:GxxExxY protein